MPTGYTAPVADGITFEQYAMGCARAFGALVMMRDEPQSTPIPERFEPSDYNQKALERTHAELERLLSLTAEQVSEEADQAYQVELEAYLERMRKAASLRDKYDAMLASVRAWNAPTSEHVKFKEFMESQIVESIKFDCNTSYDTPPERESADGWMAIRLGKLRLDFAYHENAHREEVERTEGRNQWVKALRDSLA